MNYFVITTLIISLPTHGSDGFGLCKPTVLWYNILNYLISHRAEADRLFPGTEIPFVMEVPA